MGAATIVSGGPTGLYNILLVQETTKATARLKAIKERIDGTGGNPLHSPPILPTNGLTVAIITAASALTAAEVALTDASATLEAAIEQSNTPIPSLVAVPRWYNVGKGTCTKVSPGPSCQAGNYSITYGAFIAGDYGTSPVIPDSTGFTVSSPTGSLPVAKLGTYTSSEINFTTTEGDPAFLSGDSFDVIVTDESKVVATPTTEAMAAVYAAQTDVIIKRRALATLRLEKASLEKEQALITEALLPVTRTGIWCADLTEDMAVGKAVGTIEINGEQASMNIMPAGKVGLGKLEPVLSSTPSGVFVNMATLPCWQKWKPTYRVGEIKVMGPVAGQCSVCVDEAFSAAQGLQINQDGPLCSQALAPDIVSGFADFCAANPTDPLVTNTADSTITSTAQLIADLAEVNSAVNNAYTYKKDVDQYGTLEKWNYMEPGASGDCVANYEEIYTKEGVKKIGDLKVGDIVLSYDLGTKRYDYKPIVKIWEKGLLEGIRVGLKNGCHIDISSGHPLWVRTNQGQSHGTKEISRYEKRYFKDIDLSRWWKRRMPIAKKLPYDTHDIEWMTKDLCFVIGHYLAEGWTEGSHVCSSGYDMPEHVYPILDRHNIAYSAYINNSGVPCVRYLKSKFKDYLKTLKRNSFDIHVPEEIFHLPGLKLRSLLSGFFIGDGHNGNYPQKNGTNCNKQEVYSTSSVRWAEGIQRIGLQLGHSFYVGKQENHRGAGNKPIYRISHNTNSHYFKDHGYEGLSEIGIARKHIEEIGLVEMRDFEVADTHTFIFKNGLVSHQCEDFALTKARMLLAKGYPASAIKIEVGKMATGIGHAWLTVQTDKGDLSLDLNYSEVMPAGALGYTSRYRQTGRSWSRQGVLLSSVPIEYMDGANENAFEVGDRVIVSFTGQAWAIPKVIGFESHPRLGLGMYINQTGFHNQLVMGKYTVSGVVKDAEYLNISDWGGLPYSIFEGDIYLPGEMKEGEGTPWQDCLLVRVYNLKTKALKRTIPLHFFHLPAFEGDNAAMFRFSSSPLGGGGVGSVAHSATGTLYVPCTWYTFQRGYSAWIRTGVYAFNHLTGADMGYYQYTGCRYRLPGGGHPGPIQQ